MYTLDGNNNIIQIDVKDRSREKNALLKHFTAPGCSNLLLQTFFTFKETMDFETQICYTYGL